MNFLNVSVKLKIDIDNSECGDQNGVIYRRHNQQWKYFHWMKTPLNFTDGNSVKQLWINANFVWGWFLLFTWKISCGLTHIWKTGCVSIAERNNLYFY